MRPQYMPKRYYTPPRPQYMPKRYYTPPESPVTVTRYDREEYRKGHSIFPMIDHFGMRRGFVGNEWWVATIWYQGLNPDITPYWEKVEVMADTEDELLWLLLESGRIAIGSKEVHDILRERTYVVTDLQNAAAAGGSK